VSSDATWHVKASTNSLLLVFSLLPMALLAFHSSAWKLILWSLVIFLIVTEGRLQHVPESFAWKRKRFYCRLKRQLQPKRKPIGQTKHTGKGSTVTCREPTPDRVARIYLHDLDHPSFNHGSVGMTSPLIGETESTQEVTSISIKISSSGDQHREDTWWPRLPPKPRWKVLVYRKRLGYGMDCYQAVRDAALRWDFSSKREGIVSPSSQWSTPTRATSIWSGPGHQPLVTYTKTAGLKVINPVHVIYNLVDQHRPDVALYTSTAYATGANHWIRGEERVSVILRHDAGVDVEIVSMSQPGPGLGRLVWPFLGSRQQRFFIEQMNHLQDQTGSTKSLVERANYMPRVW